LSSLQGNTRAAAAAAALKASATVSIAYRCIELRRIAPALQAAHMLQRTDHNYTATAYRESLYSQPRSQPCTQPHTITTPAHTA
jgi:hypothetical protein